MTEINTINMDSNELKEYCIKNSINYNAPTLERQLKWVAEEVKKYFTIHTKENAVHDRRLYYFIGSRKIMVPCQIINKNRRIAEIIDDKGEGWRLFRLEKTFWNKIIEWISEGRYRGLIPWEVIIDNRNPNIKHEWYSQEEEWNSQYEIDNKFNISTSIAPNKNDLLLDEIVVQNNPLDDYYADYHRVYYSDTHSDKGLDNFEYSEYLDSFKPNISYQPALNNMNMFYVAFAIEKLTLETQFNQLCKQYAIDFFPGQGFVSSTRLHEITETAKKNKKPLLILYLSDLDKQGKDMVSSMKNNINRLYSHPHHEVIKIGITPEQAKNLPESKDNEGKNKIELDAMDSNDMLQLVEMAFIKYTKHAHKAQEARDRRLRKMKERMENIANILNDDEIKAHEGDMQKWVDEYNKIKKNERRFRELFTKHTWIPFKKKMDELIDKYNEFLKRFEDHLGLKDPNKGELEEIQKNIKNSFDKLFDVHIERFHLKKKDFETPSIKTDAF